MVNVPPGMPPAKPNHDFTRKPDGAVAEFLWRRRMWFETTFVLSMLEPWEKIMLLTIFAVLFILVCSGIVLYLPQHMSVMKGRAIYYLWGAEGDERVVNLSGDVSPQNPFIILPFLMTI
uniref:Uncharacterized protein n=1 Tax=Mycena chlorophos TaxID=658473 RepID=A0ABQ0M6F4_MYCCL|nr:predicted protein [Mycena chlorophos]